MKKFFKHLALVTKHRYLVFVHCKKCGLFFRGLVHDLSKFSWTEFSESVKYFQGNRSPISNCREQNGYSLCWLKHKGRNKHHIEYWYDKQNKEQMIIPYKYLVECVCDKIAASKIYSKENYSAQNLVTYWAKDQCKYDTNQKNLDFITRVFNDLSNLGEKAVLNKKYMKKVYNEIMGIL